MSKMSVREPQAQHQKFLADLKDALLISKDKMPVIEMLAVASQFLGQLTGMQDPEKYTPDQVMEVVARNMELGNATYAEVARAMRAKHSH